MSEHSDVGAQLRTASNAGGVGQPEMVGAPRFARALVDEVSVCCVSNPGALQRNRYVRQHKDWIHLPGVLRPVFG